jgi:hypothetical protein
MRQRRLRRRRPENKEIIKRQLKMLNLKNSVPIESGGCSLFLLPLEAASDIRLGFLLSTEELPHLAAAVGRLETEKVRQRRLRRRRTKDEKTIKQVNAFSAVERLCRKTKGKPNSYKKKSFRPQNKSFDCGKNFA